MFRSNRTNRRRRSFGERARELGSRIAQAGRRVLPYLALLAVALGVPFGIFHAYIHTVSGSYFELEQVEVRGLEYLERDDVLSRAGLFEGLNIFDVEVEQVERLVEADPWVRDARVERRLPDQVSLVVEEHRPAAILISGGTYHLVDGAGQVFKQIGQGDPVDRLFALPLVTGLDHSEAQAEVGRTLLVEALEVFRLYQEVELDKRWQPISEIHVDPVLGLTVVTADTGTEVRLGRGQYRKRLERLDTVQASLVERGMAVDYILIDQDSDLSRIAVGRRTEPGIGEDGQARAD